MDFKVGGLKNVDVRMNFVSRQSSWVKNDTKTIFMTWR